MTREPVPLDVWLRAVREPVRCTGWTLREWEYVVRQARRTRLLARLGHGLLEARGLDDLPEVVRRHFDAEMQLSSWRTQSLRWALQAVTEAWVAIQGPKVLLKGSAYVAQGLPIARGRMPSDLDVLVPRSQLEQAIVALEQAGWKSADLDDQDRRYYLEWSHEVPPMYHPLHRIELDVHHGLLPPVAKTTVDTGALLDHVRPSSWDGWSVLQPVDQVLHSAAHLFLDAEPRERVRDLVDLDGLMRCLSGAEVGFWPQLSRRAEELRLERELCLALHFCRAWLHTPVPPETAAWSSRRTRRTPLLAFEVKVLGHVLAPSDPDHESDLAQHLGSLVLLSRYHWQRLPLRLLLPHLWRKWRSRHRGEAPG